MANALYQTFLEKCLTGGINVTTDTLKVALLTSDYKFSAADTDCTSLSSAVLGSSSQINGITVSGSQVSIPAAPVSGVADGLTVSAMVLYKDGGSWGASVPILYANVGTGLPLKRTARPLPQTSLPQHLTFRRRQVDVSGWRVRYPPICAHTCRAST